VHRRALLAGLLAAPLASAARGRGRPLVAAASDLRYALDAVADAFVAAGGVRPEIVYGASGRFHQQIVRGAPFELYLAADESYVLDLARRGLTVDRGRLYALGRLVLFAPTGSALAVDPRLDGLARALAAGRIRRIAVASPEHAPYGMRAREALRARGLWDGLAGRLVFGASVAEAARYAFAGQVDGGLFALSLALAPPARGRGRHAVVDPRLHSPLRQRMVRLRGASAAAGAFYDFLAGGTARTLLARFGFGLPGE